MVRLVFRPYTRVQKAICTSTHLRPSTRVSSGFGLLGHSSPSFGSQQVCSNSNLSQKIMVGQWCILKSNPTGQCLSAIRVLHPFTRIPARLLGPCFKTGCLRAFTHHHSSATNWLKVGITLPYCQYVTDGGLHSELTMLNEHRGPNASGARKHFSLNIFKYFEPSFQSSFHLSLTVLVRYRCSANI
jgi:hypothetical protein